MAKSWNMVFVTAFISVLIFSMVSAVVAAQPVVVAIADALAVDMGSSGKWCRSLWMRFEKAVRGPLKIVSWTRIRTCIVKEMDNITVLVRKVEIDIISLLKKAEFTKEREVRRTIGRIIKRRLDKFTLTIEELAVHAEKYCRNVTMATTNLQNYVDNKIEPVIEEKKQENVSESSTMMSDYKPPLVYKVFINFGGEDLRHGFVHNLVKALEKDGVNVYIDEDEVRRRDLAELLLNGIKEPRIALVIFSSGYTETRWCLNELVKIKELMERGKLLVITIFYKVEPWEVSQLKGDFGIKFWNLWRIYRDSHIVRWKEALESVASMEGIYLKEHSSESEFITCAVKEVLKRVSLWEGENPSLFPSTERGRSTELSIGTGEKHETYQNKQHLFGMERHMELLEKKLEFDCNETRIIGIVGMPGIGKTTLAVMLHEKWNCQFIRCVPLMDIRKKSNDYGPVWLRKELLEVLLEGKFPVISDNTTHQSVQDILLQTKVFVVLDDVSDKKQLEFLLGDLGWVKKGSKIVISTCDKSLLDGYAHDAYVVPVLNDREAFQLFNYHAFDDKICSPTSTFLTLSRMFVNYARGHPLALSLLGRELHGKDKAHWEHKLATLTSLFQDVWRFSTDQLNERQKDVFLDIACFFKSEDEYFVRSLLDSGDPDSVDTVSEVRDLANKFLITVSDSLVNMNDMLYKFEMDIGSPRWLTRWNYKDYINESKPIEKSKAYNLRGILLDMSELKKSIYLERSIFINMLNLRYLKIYDSCCARKCIPDCKLDLHDGIEFPLKEVRYLHWVQFPLEEFPLDFKPENLIDLRLPYSKIRRIWKGVKDTPRLKWVDLSYSSKLLDLSALSKAENLRSLNLEGCTILDELPVEIQNMKSLVLLNLRGCICLSSLPLINLISLKILILTGCTSLQEFQLISESLEVLHLNSTAIKGLPPTIIKLQRLVLLNLKNCKRLESLPNCIGDLKALEELILSGCSGLKNLSDVTESMKHIQSLLMDRIGAKQMPLISCVSTSKQMPLISCASHRAFGPVLRSNLPPHWSDNKLTGIALCAVISFPNYHEQRNPLLVTCTCVFNNEYESRMRFSCIIGSWSELSNTPGKIEASHVFIGYTSTLDMKKHGEVENEEGRSHTEALFEFQVTDGAEVLQGCEVLKCGFSLYYATDELRVKSSVSGPVEANQYISYSENVTISNVRPESETAEILPAQRTATSSQPPTTESPVSPQGYETSDTDPLLSGDPQQHRADLIPAVASSSFQAGLRRSHSQVFVSFHGGELRKTFVRHLVSTLTDAGISVFTDNEKGNGIKLQNFYKRIEESKIVVAIFSERYIDSHFCLDELVVMDKLAKEDKLLVIPVFYNVRPSDVKHLKGEFGRRFKEMRVRYKDEAAKVLKWETSVKSIAKKIGVHSELYGEDASLVEATVEAVQRALTKIPEGNPKSLGGGNKAVDIILYFFASIIFCHYFLHFCELYSWFLVLLVVICSVVVFYHLNKWYRTDRKKQWLTTASPPPLAQSDNIFRKWFGSVVSVRSTKEPKMRRESPGTRVSEYSVSSISGDLIVPDNLPKEEAPIATQLSNSSPDSSTSAFRVIGGPTFEESHCVIS